MPFKTDVEWEEEEEDELGGNVGNIKESQHQFGFQRESRVVTWSDLGSTGFLCRSCFGIEDQEHWELIEPARVLLTDGTVKYRIMVTSGRFQCRVTGLRWESSCKVELEYCMDDWEHFWEFLEMENFIPGGPLMDIKVISGELSTVHLPHFLCLGFSHQLSDISILCTKNTGICVKRCKLSYFYTNLSHSTFLPKGVLVRSRLSLKVHCDLLIYRTSTAHLTFHLYLIPRDPKIKESVEKREKSSIEISKQGPDVSLEMKDHYTLISSCSSQITPQKLKLRYISKTPSLFKVYLDDIQDGFLLGLITEANRSVWTAYIRPDEIRRNSSDAATLKALTISETLQHPESSPPATTYPESSPPVLTGKDTKVYETAEVKIVKIMGGRSKTAADQKDETDKPEKELAQSSRSICTSCSSLQDTRKWKLIEPEADENLQYGVSSPAGIYECAVSGLRWVSDGAVSLKYHFADWEPYSEDLRRMNFEPCGPLMDITVISGVLKEVHLPHFACLGSSPLLNDEVRVLDVQDGEMFLETCELTRFHAKLLHPTFSPKGLLIRSGFPVKVHSEVLIYQTLTAHLTLHVYLVTYDLKIIQDVDKMEKDAVKILKPGPERSLPMKSRYKIETKKESKHVSSTIKPERLKLRYTPIKYCEVYIKNPDDDFELHLINEKKESIWDVVIRAEEYSRVSSLTSSAGQKDKSKEHAVWFVKQHRTELIQRVSLVTPIADDLKDLIGDEKYSDIKKFQTSHEQMRALYSFLSGGQRLEERFYKSLLRHEPHLVADLTGLD